MICYIMGISVLNLLRNKVLHYHRAIGIWLEFPDNLWVEAASPLPKGPRALVSDSNGQFTVLRKATFNPHNHQALNVGLKHGPLCKHHQGNLHQVTQ